MHKFGCLSSNTLKLVALISMTIDHFGFLFFPYISIFRILGRLAFPIFAYFIAEGCKYTHNKLSHFLHLFIPAIVFQLIYSFLFSNKVISIFGTFSVSVLLVYFLEYMKKIFNESSYLFKILLISVCLTIFYLVYFINCLIKFDYGFIGMISPALISIFKNKYIKLLLLSLCLILLTFKLYFENSMYMFYINMFNLLAIPLLLCYNDKKGKLKLKYFFYLYYPAHLMVLYGIYYLFM